MKRDEREEVIYRALRGVETPEYDILGAVKAAREEIPRRRRPHLTRAALLAACLAAALTVGAVADQRLSGIHHLVGVFQQSGFVNVDL